MSPLTIDITDQQHQSLKALAALQGKTIKQYTLERLFPGDTDGELAWQALKTLLGALIRCTRQHWGDAQVRRHITKLEQGIEQPARPTRFQGHERPASRRMDLMMRVAHRV